MCILNILYAIFFGGGGLTAPIQTLSKYATVADIVPWYEAALERVEVAEVPEVLVGQDDLEGAPASAKDILLRGRHRHRQLGPVTPVLNRDRYIE